MLADDPNGKKQDFKRWTIKVSSSWMLEISKVFSTGGKYSKKEIFVIYIIYIYFYFS